MAFFSYQGTDGQGRPTQGTIQAPSAEEAGRLLRSGGVRASSVRELGAASPPRPVASTPVVQARPLSMAAPKAVAAAPAPYVRTRMGTDKERFFLFSQMAAAYRAGISPYQSLSEIAARSAEKYRPALQQAALAVRDGGSLADALAPYEDLFPDHAIATVRAGETGGFVPDALDEVSRQAEEAHKFKRWFFWVWFVAINALLSIPRDVDDDAGSPARLGDHRREGGRDLAHVQGDGRGHGAGLHRRLGADDDPALRRAGLSLLVHEIASHAGVPAPAGVALPHLRAAREARGVRAVRLDDVAGVARGRHAPRGRGGWRSRRCRTWRCASP